MIGIRVYFEKSRLTDLLLTLLEFPASVRPRFFGESEKIEGQANRVDDSADFGKFVSAHPGGFFLFADDALFQFFTAGDKPCYFVASLSNDLPPDSHRIIFQRLAAIDVPFALISEVDEFEHRNHLCHRVGKNSIESWVGRDIRKYLPGLYWCTMISIAALDELGVELDALTASAISSDRLGNCHLLQFYRTPDDWKSHADRLDELCESVDGVFSSRFVDRVAREARNYIEYSDVVDAWS